MLARAAPATSPARFGRRAPVAGAEPIPIRRQQAVDVGGDQHSFDQPLDDPRDDQADEEDQAGADQPRQEGEDLGDQFVDRGENLPELRESCSAAMMPTSQMISLAIVPS